MTDSLGARGLIDLASRDLGGSVIWCSDEFFADAARLIQSAEPTHDASAFTTRGKTYDGWESRRRRMGDRDSAIIRLGAPGVIHGVVIDTAFFTGNAPAEVSLEGLNVDDPPSLEELLASPWTPILDRTPVSPDCRTLLEAPDNSRRYTHVRLTIYPDGGVARLRVLGEAVPDPRFLLDTVDLLALEVGGHIVTTSNEFYSSSTNVLRPGPARGMDEGWENARRRVPGHEFIEIALGLPGSPQVLEVDTSHFIGNAPKAVRAHGFMPGNTGTSEGRWIELLPETPVQPDTRHRWLVAADEEISALRLDAIPDGGISRVRLWGRISPATREQVRLRAANISQSGS